jgi:hypothetical protein
LTCRCRCRCRCRFGIGKQALAIHAEEVFDQSIPGRLVLITCEDWNGKIYLGNVVVIAVPAA